MSIEESILYAFDLKAIWDKFPPNHNTAYLPVIALERHLIQRLKTIKKAKIKPTDQQSALAEFARQVEEMVYGEMLAAIKFKKDEGQTP